MTRKKSDTFSILKSGLWALSSGAGLIAAQLPVPAAVPVPDRIQYNRDIQPILSENCFACHGADSAARKAGLRLDHFEDAWRRARTARRRLCPANRKAANSFAASPQWIRT